jgi:hypothetical protein
VKHEKRAKNAKKEVFEFKLISILVKKWMSWGCSIFEHTDHVLG